MVLLGLGSVDSSFKVSAVASLHSKRIAQISISF